MPLNQSKSSLDRVTADLQVLGEFRDAIDQMILVYRKKEAALFESPGSQAEFVCQHLQSGAVLIWGLAGWQIQQPFFKVSSTVVLELIQAKLVEADENGLVRWIARPVLLG